MSELTLGQRQELFVRTFSEFLRWFYGLNIEHAGWELRFGEGYVGDTDGKDGDYDGPHKHNGGHYNKTAIDMNLFVRGDWIKDSSAKEWQEIGRKWLALHPLARWGGVFGDSNHLAILLKIENGQEYY